MGTGRLANANKLAVIGRPDRAVVSLEATGRGERVRCMPQIGSNIYAIGMITALRDYVRLLRAIPMLTLSSHHQHPPPHLSSVPPRVRVSTSSMTSYINGKSGLLNYRSRDTRIVLAGHATSVSKTFLLVSSLAPRRFFRCTCICREHCFTCVNRESLVSRIYFLT